MKGRASKGAGRKPGQHGAKVNFVLRVPEDIKRYLESTGNANQSVDDTIGKTKAFREWKREQM